MNTHGIKRTLPLALLTAMVMVPAAVSAARAETYTGPIKEQLSSHIGWEVNKTTKGEICLVSEACQPGKESNETGGFDGDTHGVAVNNDPASSQDGDVYVIDNSHRVQELSAAGAFVSTFGWEVNMTKDETPGATQAEKNVCTAKSGDVCKAGVEGPAPGQFGELISLAVDPINGDVYVADRQNDGKITEEGGKRVQKFTAEGQFLLEIGKEVNETEDKTSGANEAQKNLCTAGEACIGPAPSDAETTKPGAFVKPAALAVDGPEDLLYVGDEHRVQEFEADGKYKREIPLTSISAQSGSRVGALAVDEAGDVYLAYEVHFISAPTIREFTPDGSEVKNAAFPLTLEARQIGAFNFSIGQLAIDASGRLAVDESENTTEQEPPHKTDITSFGSLLSGSTGVLITEYTLPSIFGGAEGLAFSANGDLYAAVEREVLAYTPVRVAELLSSGVACRPGGESETSATINCTLSGEANPEGVEDTEAWFQWGRTTELGSETVKESVVNGETLAPIAPVPLDGLRPNETYYERLAGYDHNVQPPESVLRSQKGSFITSTVAPKIVDEPSVSFVGSASAVMFGELNPENAKTEYFFEYGQGEALAKCPNGVRKAACPGVASTGVLESAVYGKIGATLEVGNLVPGTVYHYRLSAESENTGKTEKLASRGEGQQEGSFTTAPAPLVAAQTGVASAVAATSAVVTGTVNPEGQPATYAFELGVYQGASTQYGVVFSGQAGAASAPVEESLPLTGLLPGTTYAYRVKIASGYGEATGEALLFTTAGLPAVLEVPSPLPLLAVPSIAFPTPVIPPKTKTPKTVTKKKTKKTKPKKRRKGKSKQHKAHKTSTKQ